jgi:hypothetical protein
MRRFLAPTAIAGMVVALSMFGGGPASAAPQGASVLSTPGPWPPSIPPPHCVARDQSNGTYEWLYDGERRLGDAKVYKFWISSANPIANKFELSVMVTCQVTAGRVGSGLNL